MTAINDTTLDFDHAAWRLDAVCRGADPNLFFPGRGESTHIAKAMCRRCPVMLECRDYSLTIPDLRGVFGGLSEKERKLFRRNVNGPRPLRRNLLGGAA